jgi:hypothetical protein
MLRRVAHVGVLHFAALQEVRSWHHSELLIAPTKVCRVGVERKRKTAAVKACC